MAPKPHAYKGSRAIVSLQGSHGNRIRISHGLARERTMGPWIGWRDRWAGGTDLLVILAIRTFQALWRACALWSLMQDDETCMGGAKLVNQIMSRFSEYLCNGRMKDEGVDLPYLLCRPCFPDVPSPSNTKRRTMVELGPIIHDI